jgi:glyoxylase-like metal-dependent hydrolase (beta-lactamase superfamily II)
LSRFGQGRAAMEYLSEPAPERHVKLPVLPGIARVVADNPGRMTYHGTNSYVFHHPDVGGVVLDPGPDEPAQVDALLAAAGGRIGLILLTHSHLDHIGAAAALAAASKAPIAAFAPSALAGFVPDIALADGDQIAGLLAVHTPGHASDHLCFATPDGVLFSGDHVMAWSSSIVARPGGDMAAYLASLDRLRARDDHLYLPGHGPALPEPGAYVAALHAHRLAREAAILAALRQQPASVGDLVRLLYVAIPPAHWPAAERNLLSHLDKLADEGRARLDGALWRAVHPGGFV